MKNLDNLGVIALNQNEIQKTEGGLLILGVAVSAWWIAGGAAAAVVAVGAYVGYEQAADAAE